MNTEDAERLLSVSPDYKVLKRVPPAAAWGLHASSNNLMRGVYVDVETTGLNESDEVIELALLPFEYDRSTGIVASVLEDEAYSALRQPLFPIPDASVLIHGITNEDVAGCVVDAAHVEAIIKSANIVLAHNAAFDRPMVEKHWPIFERSNWACSLADVDWRAEGMGSGKLDYLLMTLGWFYDNHRALTDALAGVFLLTRTLPKTGKPVLDALLACARKPLKAVRAEGAAFEAKEALKQRGYRWDPGDQERSKAWWILTEDADTEITWLNTAIYSTPRDIRPVDVPPTRRFTSRLWES